MSTNTTTAPRTEAAPSRRGFFMKLGILFNGFAAIVLALLVARFLFSSTTENCRNLRPPVGCRCASSLTQSHGRMEFSARLVLSSNSGYSKKR